MHKVIRRITCGINLAYNNNGPKFYQVLKLLTSNGIDKNTLVSHEYYPDY